MHRFIMAQEGIPSFVQSLIILPKTRKYGKTFMMPLEQTIAGTPTPQRRASWQFSPQLRRLHPRAVFREASARSRQAAKTTTICYGPEATKHFAAE